MKTAAEIARDSFTTDTRAALTDAGRDEHRHATSEQFYKLTDDAPDWLRDAVWEAHGDMLPDDGIYELCTHAADDIANGQDDAGEWADGMCDVYNAQLVKWLASHQARAALVDEAIEELGWPGGLFKALQYGQYMEARRVFDTIKSAIDDAQTELDAAGEEAEVAAGGSDDA